MCCFSGSFHVTDSLLSNAFELIVGQYELFGCTGGQNGVEVWTGVYLPLPHRERCPKVTFLVVLFFSQFFNSLGIIGTRGLQ